MDLRGLIQIKNENKMKNTGQTSSSSSRWFINAMTNSNAVKIESSNNTITSNK